MSTQQALAPPPQPPPSPPLRIGVGIDTSRYGHYAAFLREDHQPAAAELPFAESAAGYAQFRQRLDHLAGHHPAVSFVIRLDAAGQYADNLLNFLHHLAKGPQTQTCVILNSDISISCGDPQRNKNYRAALFGSKKSDPIEARAAARFAISERPTATPPPATELRTLRQVASRLQATVRQRTRVINQFHHLLALTFPELALLVKDISLGWVLELVQRYPTAQLLAGASAHDLACIPYLPDKHRARLLELASTSIASLNGSTSEELVRDQVRQLRDVSARQKRLETLLIEAYRRLPKANHLDTIPGIGAVTAAVLTAFILDINRFDTPNKLVAYFGVQPIEMSSGIDRDGQPRASRRFVMSKRGNDLVRRYLWMAALSAVRCNPAVRALYARVVAKHPQHKAIAIGHAMRKLLHLVFAIWKTDKPFNGEHLPWEKPTHEVAVPQPGAGAAHAEPSEKPSAPEIIKNQTAGHKPDAKPAAKVVTAACSSTVAAEEPVGEATFIDFAHLKSQLSLVRVFEHLGLSARLRGSGSQRRCACPIHRADGRGRTFSVNLDDNVFQCFDTRCGKQGDVIDLWAELQQMTLRAAAIDLVRTFSLEPAPTNATEKRHG
jgi:transposase